MTTPPPMRVKVHIPASGTASDVGGWNPAAVVAGSLDATSGISLVLVAMIV